MDELHENSRDDNVDKQRGKQTKKRKVQDDDDEEEEEHENTHDSDDDSSSTHKKGRVFWSQELHHKFVLAVNQLSIDKAVPRKILDLMKVENLTRENVASHLQKYRLHLKKQANMVAASGNGNPSNLRMGSLSGVGSFQTLSGSEKFHHNNAFGSFPTALNNPAGQNVYGLPSSGTHQFGQAQNFNSSNNYDQLKFQSAIGHRYQNVVQATPISKWFSDQFPDSLTDIHSQGVFSASTSKQVNNNMPFQWWDDHNQDASNYSNVIGSSMNSLTPMNGAVGPECHTSTNSTFNRNPDFYFGDPVQMKHEGIMEFNVGNSVKPQQVHTINQQESQKSCVANNVRSFEELIAASSSGSSQESAEIAELRKEMAETRYEHLKLKEMMVQQDRLLQTIIQFVCTMQQQPEPALNLH